MTEKIERTCRELDAMKAVSKALEGLDEEQIKSVLTWALKTLTNPPQALGELTKAWPIDPTVPLVTSVYAAPFITAAYAAPTGVRYGIQQWVLNPADAKASICTSREDQVSTEDSSERSTR